MGEITLPRRHRPLDVPYRKCSLGLDLPSWFVSEIQAIDRNLYPVWHKWRLLWDPLINVHEGETENPRYTVNYDFNTLNFGFPLTDGKGAPIPENKWHFWYLADQGWYHVIGVDSKIESHLKRVIKLLSNEAKLKDRGHKAYVEAKREAQEKRELKVETDAAEKFGYLENENRKLTTEAKENFERGHTKPTNPMKQSIISYPGQTNRSSLHVPVTDKDAGLTTWEDLE